MRSRPPMRGSTIFWLMASTLMLAGGLTFDQQAAVIGGWLALGMFVKGREEEVGDGR